MKEFNTIINEVEKLSVTECQNYITIGATHLIPALQKLTNNGVQMFASFIVAALLCDNKITEKEYEVVLPYFKQLFGNEYNDKHLKEMIKSIGKNKINDFQKNVDALYDLFSYLDEQLGQELIVIVLVILGCDGKVSLKEQSFLKRLMA